MKRQRVVKKDKLGGDMKEISKKLKIKWLQKSKKKKRKLNKKFESVEV